MIVYVFGFFMFTGVLSLAIVYALTLADPKFKEEDMKSWHAYLATYGVLSIIASVITISLG